MSRLSSTDQKNKRGRPKKNPADVLPKRPTQPKRKRTTPASTTQPSESSSRPPPHVKKPKLGRPLKVTKNEQVPQGAGLSRCRSILQSLHGSCVRRVQTSLLRQVYNRPTSSMIWWISLYVGWLFFLTLSHSLFSVFVSHCANHVVFCFLI